MRILICYEMSREDGPVLCSGHVYRSVPQFTQVEIQDKLDAIAAEAKAEFAKAYPATPIVWGRPVIRSVTKLDG